MLWTLITAIIYKNQIEKSSNNTMDSEHTPGFYKIESVRLQKYSTAMDKKLASAISRHERANHTMSHAAQMGKPSAIQNHIYAKLIAAENLVLLSRHLATNAVTDSVNMTSMTRDTNQDIDFAYDLAYGTKRTKMKYILSKIRAK